MVQSELYYMITINQSPDCEVPLKDVESGLLKYAKERGERYMLAEEEGSINGKAHFHLCIELSKETRKDNVTRAIQSHTKVLKNKYSIDIRGTRGTPHKETWEIHAIDYVAKGFKYNTNMCKEFIEDKISTKKLKDKVDQKTIYIDRPKFWKLYREELMKYERINRMETETVRHDIMQLLLGTYTPLWLKPHIVAAIIEYQEGLDIYESTLESLVNVEIFGKRNALEVTLLR